jgi:DNA-binding response OmpR family regulator
LRLLLADDDPNVLVPLEIALQRDGFEVMAAGDGDQAWELFENQRPDFAVLDVTMPGTDGLELIRQIRDAGDPYVPVILLSGRGQERDRITGLDQGADDYVVKPCSHRELVARIRAVWRRAGTAPRMHTAGSLTLDAAMHKCYIADREVHLTAQEFILLKALMERAGQVVPIGTIMRHVWGGAISSDLLRVTIYRLRRKIEVNPKSPRFLHTVSGVGFMIWDTALSPLRPPGQVEAGTDR